MSNVAAGKDTDDEGEKLNDVEKALNKLNIKTRDSLKEWRNFEDIIDEVAEKWKDFTSTEQSQIATAIAGTRQQEIFRSMMENWDEVERLTKVAANSTGTASEKMEVYLDSVEAKTNELKTTWENFVMSLGQSESWKDVLDSLIWMLDNMPIMIGYLTTIGGILLTFKMPTIIENLNNLRLSVVDLMKNISLSTVAVEGQTIALAKNDIQTIKMIMSQTQLGVSQKANHISYILSKSGIDAETASKIANKIATQGLTAATVTLTSVLQIATLAITAVVAVITIATNAYNNHQQALLDASNATREHADSLKQEEDSLDAVKDKYEEIINTTGTAEEKKEKLKSLQQELNNVYDQEKEKIDLVNGSYDEQIKKLEQVTKSKEAERLAELQSGKKNDDEILDTTTKNVIKGYDSLDKGVLNDIAAIGGQTNTKVGRSAAGNLVIDSTKRNLVDFRDKLVELQKYYNNLGLTEKAAQLGNIMSGANGFLWQGTKSINEDADSAKDARANEKERHLLEFKQQNQEEYTEYENFIKQKKELKEKYDKAESNSEKEKIYNEYEKLYNENLDKITELYHKGSKDVKDAMLKDNGFNSFVELFSGSDFLSWSDEAVNSFDQIGKSSIEVQALMDKVTKEIKDSGEISEDSQKKIFELYSLIMSDDNLSNTLLPTFINYLKQIGIEVPKTLQNIKAIKDLENKKGSLGQENGEIDSLKRQYNTSKTSINDTKLQRVDSFANIAKEAIKNGDTSFTVYQKKNGGEFTTTKDNTTQQTGMTYNLKDGKWTYLGNEATDLTNLQKKQDVANQTATQLQNKKQDIVNSAFDLIGDETTKKQIKEELKDKINDFINNADSETKPEDIFNAIIEKIQNADIKPEDFKTGNKQDYGLKYEDKSNGMGMGSSSDFETYQKDIKTVQDNINDINDGKYLDLKEIEKLTILSDEAKNEITKDGKITAEELQKYLDETKENLDDNLDKVDELADEVKNNLGDSIKDLSKDDGFEDFADNVDRAQESIHNLVKESGKLDNYSNDFGFNWDFEDLDLTNLDDMQKRLDKVRQYTNEAKTATDEYNESIGENGNKLDENTVAAVANMTAMTDMSMMAPILAQQLSGDEGSLTAAWDALGMSELFSTETKQRFNEMGIDVTQSSSLDQILAHWDELTKGEQGCLNALIAYLIQYGNLTDDQKQILQNALTVTGGATNEVYQNVKQQTAYRRAGNATKPKKSSGSKSSKKEYTPEEAEKDKKSILNDIEDYEKDIEADLEDQTEQLINHYNLERNKLDTLREELDYYDSIYDSVEDTTKWLETQLKILDEESDKVSEMQNANEKIDAQRKKIYSENKQYNVESWFDSEGNDTLAYGDMLNNFEYQKEAIQQETARKMRAEYNKIANSTDKDVIKDAKEKIKLIEEEGDLKIKELEKEKEKVENIHDSVETLNDAGDENQEKIRESLQELNDRIKDVRDTLIDQMMEQLEEATDKMNKSIEKDVTRLEQLKQIQESYNSILNDTIDTQDELLDELQANLDSYQYLDEDMRQLMFNEDDYKKLSGVLGDIQKDIADIWEDHYNQIQNLTEDEMYKAEYITAETERQLATKQKQYELAKAELDIAKAKTNLENVKNERNTRIFANGEWQWVADPTAVRDAQKQVSDAERAKNKIEREEEQQKLIDGLDRLIDADNLQIDKNNELLDKIKEAIEAETKEVKSIDDALDNIKTANLPDLNTTLVNALGEDGGHMTELLRSINKSQTTLAAALRGQTVDQAVNQLKSGKMDKKAFEELVTRLGYSFNETTGKVTTQDGSFDAHYSGWTKKSNNDTQTTTGKNGVQVTGNKPSGNGGQQQSSPASSIQSVNNKNSQEELKRIAKEVWQGKWGNGQNRKDRLAAAGYDYAAVQALVNKGRSYFFDQGGVSTGIGLMAKDTLEPERVLSPRQTKSFENLVNNLTTNPVLNALSRNPSIVSNLPNMGNTTSNDKNYYFSNFTVQANDIGQFIDSIETMLPMKN